MGNEYQHRLIHYGIKGQKWGVRRFETEDGHLTEAGKDRYLDAVSKISRKQDRVQKKIDRNEKKREKYDKLRAKHERKLGRNYISRRFLLSKRYHAWRHEINGVKQEKYRRKVERGKRKFERYQKQFRFLYKNNIETEAELENYRKSKEETISELTEERKRLYASRTEGNESQIKQEADKINAELKALRADVRMCKAISKDAYRISEKQKQADALIEQEKKELKENEHNRIVR